jgi:hypothetical protein
MFKCGMRSLTIYGNVVVTKHFVVETTNLLLVPEMLITLSNCLVGSL